MLLSNSALSLPPQSPNENGGCGPFVQSRAAVGMLRAMNGSPRGSKRCVHAAPASTREPSISTKVCDYVLQGFRVFKSILVDAICTMQPRPGRRRRNDKRYVPGAAGEKEKFDSKSPTMPKPCATVRLSPPRSLLMILRAQNIPVISTERDIDPIKA